MNGNYVKKKFKCNQILISYLNFILSFLYIIRLQDIRQKLFIKNLHDYINIDENLTQNIIDLTRYRLEKQFKIQHQKLEINTLRSNFIRKKKLFQK